MIRTNSVTDSEKTAIVRALELGIRQADVVRILRRSPATVRKYVHTSSGAKHPQRSQYETYRHAFKAYIDLIGTHSGNLSEADQVLIELLERFLKINTEICQFICHAMQIIDAVNAIYVEDESVIPYLSLVMTFLGKPISIISPKGEKVHWENFGKEMAKQPLRECFAKLDVSQMPSDPNAACRMLSIHFRNKINFRPPFNMSTESCNLFKLHTEDMLRSSLTEIEIAVLNLRFGLGSNARHTLHETAKKLSKDDQVNMYRMYRIRQIEAKALLKLRHPSRSRILRRFLDLGHIPDTKRQADM